MWSHNHAGVRSNHSGTLSSKKFERIDLEVIRDLTHAPPVVFPLNRDQRPCCFISPKPARLPSRLAKAQSTDSTGRPCVMSQSKIHFVNARTVDKALRPFASTDAYHGIEPRQTMPSVCVRMVTTSQSRSTQLRRWIRARPLRQHRESLPRFAPTTRPEPALVRDHHFLPRQ